MAWCLMAPPLHEPEWLIIIWINVDWSHMASPGLYQLTHCGLVTPFAGFFIYPNFRTLSDQKSGSPEHLQTSGQFLYILVWILYAFDRHEVKMSCYKIQPAKTLHLVTQIWVNIGSGNGLLPDSTKPLSEPDWLIIIWINGDQVRYGITRAPWVNSLCPRDTIWWHKSGSTLAQIMACCLMAPSHYLNQCWLIRSNVQWHSSDGNFTRHTSAINN